MFKRWMTRMTRTPILYATTAGLLLGIPQALVLIVRRGTDLGDDGPAGMGVYSYVGVMGFPVAAVMWWLFIARRNPSETSVRRGVAVGALSPVAEMIIVETAYFAMVLLKSLGTETAGDWLQVAGEGALLLTAGIIMGLLSAWIGILAGMIIGGALVAFQRRVADPMTSDQFERSAQAPPGRTRCDGCGEEFPSNHYLTDAGLRGCICRSCANSH